MNIKYINDKNSIRPKNKIKHNLLANLVLYIKKFTSTDRFDLTYFSVLNELNFLKKNFELKKVFLLDYGCGAMNFSLRLIQERKIYDFIAMDIYQKPKNNSTIDADKWRHYRKIPKNNRFNLYQKFDIALLLDVLHHIKEEEQIKVLKDISNASKFIIVKDHFEYSFFSR